VNREECTSRKSDAEGEYTRVWLKPMAPSGRPDEVVADDFRPDPRFYRPVGSASDEVADEAIQRVPPRLHPRAYAIKPVEEAWRASKVGAQIA